MMEIGDELSPLMETNCLQLIWPTGDLTVMQRSHQLSVDKYIVRTDFHNVTITFDLLAHRLLLPCGTFTPSSAFMLFVVQFSGAA